MVRSISNREDLQKAKERHGDFLVLGFWGRFSEAAERGLVELGKFSREQDDVPVYLVDVGEARGLHKQFGVEKVPTVLTLENGKVTRFFEGVQSARFYAVHLSGAAASRAPGTRQATVQRVTVYSGQHCPACGQLKAYLRRHGVAFREVDISSDPRAADRIARRSGMMAVPQTDINGRLVVGFDRAKLERFLGIPLEGVEP